jgi:hypothetical protein
MLPSMDLVLSSNGDILQVIKNAPAKKKYRRVPGDKSHGLDPDRLVRVSWRRYVENLHGGPTGRDPGLE